MADSLPPLVLDEARCPVCLTQFRIPMRMDDEDADDYVRRIQQPKEMICDCAHWTGFVTFGRTVGVGWTR